MHLWSSLFSWGSVRSCVAVWRRAPFRLNIATHSLRSVREQSLQDLFLPGTDWVPQPGLSSAALLISRMGFCESVPLFLSLSQGSLARKRLSSFTYLVFPVEVGSVFPEVLALVCLVVSLKQSELIPEIFLHDDLQISEKAEARPWKHCELQHVNSSIELNKSVYCMADCKARYILGTKNEKLEVSFF